MRIGRSAFALTLLLGIGSSSAEAATISYLLGSQSCGQSSSSTGTCDNGTTVMNWQAFGDETTLKLSIDYSAQEAAADPRIFGSAVGGGVTISDLLSVTGLAAGSTGSIVFNWSIDGTLSANGFLGYSTIQLDYQSSPVQQWAACGSTVSSLCTGLASSANEVVSVTVPFTVGQNLSVSFALRGGTTGGQVNFFNTALLQPLVVLDASGAQVTANVTSTSGFNYAVAPVVSTVPEPSTLLLLGTGALAAIRRRRIVRQG